VFYSLVDPGVWEVIAAPDGRSNFILAAFERNDVWVTIYYSIIGKY
jgi:hypothetical protein